jgi:SAM-dependent methyltransferase
MNDVTIKEFFDAWSIYDHILEHNYMFHNEIYRDVGQLLARRFNHQPFSMLDLGCGSARHLTQTLRGSRVQAYAGYDLSDTAIEHAQRNLSGLGIPIDLQQGDLLEGLEHSHGPFDLIFSSFAVHHLSTGEKTNFFKAAAKRLSEDGMLLLIDVMRNEGEDRPVYLERYCSWLRSAWTTLSETALDEVCSHICGNDYPETASQLYSMATEAGLLEHRELCRFGWHSTLYFCKPSTTVRTAHPT